MNRIGPRTWGREMDLGLLRYADWAFVRAFKLRQAGDVDGAERLEQRALEYRNLAKPNERQQPEMK
jgi:hypothetical protein